ncbi:MAG: hypothetical protein R3B09_35285 [Nannocystaceae bacterium]
MLLPLRRPPVVLPLALLLACSGGKEEDGSATVTASGIHTVSASVSASATATATAGTTEGDTEGATEGATEGGTSTSEGSTSEGTGATTKPPPKFDVGDAPDGGRIPEDEGCKNVDLLFVIDNSGSMSDEQSNLVNSFPGFVSTMQMQLQTAMSYHVGIVTSDADIFNNAPCNQLGGLVTRTAGANSSNQNCLPYASGKNYMDENDDLAQKFQCAALVGTAGDGNEQPMSAMGLALGPGLNSPGACNDGFIRKDALLVIVVITDEEDDHEVVDACTPNPQSGSAGDPPNWYQTVTSIKDGIETNIVVLALVGPPQPNACPALDKCNSGITGAEVASRIVQFTQMFTYGSVGQVCSPTYDAFFAGAIGVIDSACKNYMPPA